MLKSTGIGTFEARTGRWMVRNCQNKCCELDKSQKLMLFGEIKLAGRLAM